MSTHATASFDVKSWDDEPYDESEGLPKLVRSHVVQSYQGDIEGEGRVEYLMMHRDDGTASYVGLERVAGRIGDRSGSFVLHQTGTYDSDGAKTTFSVVPGSGTGDLAGLRGKGGYIASEGRHVLSVTLDYDFE